MAQVKELLKSFNLRLIFVRVHFHSPFWTISLFLHWFGINWHVLNQLECRNWCPYVINNINSRSLPSACPAHSSVGPGQRSRFLVLIKRSAASGGENAFEGSMGRGRPVPPGRCLKSNPWDAVWGYFQHTSCTAVDDFLSVYYWSSPIHCLYKCHGKKVREDWLTEANRSKNKQLEDFNNK